LRKLFDEGGLVVPPLSEREKNEMDAALAALINSLLSEGASHTLVYRAVLRALDGLLEEGNDAGAKVLISSYRGGIEAPWRIEPDEREGRVASLVALMINAGPGPHDVLVSATDKMAQHLREQGAEDMAERLLAWRRELLGHGASGGCSGTRAAFGAASPG
jgi:hypothetical protein